MRPILNLNKNILTLAFLWMALGQAFAQKFSDKPDQFATDVTNFMRLSKIPSTIAVADNFSSAWGSLNADQQQTVIRTVQLFTKSHLRAKPYYESYMQMIVEAVNQLGSDQKNLTNLLISAEKVMINEKPANIVGFCETSRSFLTNKTLYFSKFYNLRVEAPSFEFAYVDAAPAFDPIPEAKPAEEKPKEEPKPAPAPKPKPKPKPKPADDGWGAPAPAANDGWGAPASDPWATPPKKKKKPAKKKPATDDWGAPTQQIKESDPNDWGNGSTTAAAETTATAKPKSSIMDMLAAENAASKPESGAIIRFNKIDLTFATGYDSTTLRGASGYFSIANQEFVGKGGRFDWSSVGMPEVYAELGSYSFPVKKAEIQAPYSKLHYESKLELPVVGDFEFKSVKHGGPETAIYPAFISEQAETKYKNLGEDVDLYGGFSLQGIKLNTSSKNGQSRLAVRYAGKEVYRGVAKRFDISDSALTSPGTYSTIPRGLDSVTQANGRLVYKRQYPKSIKLYKDKGSFTEAPFFDSFHRMEIVSDIMVYGLDSNHFDFYITQAKTKKPAVIESTDYFTDDRYSDIQGLKTFDPIGMVIAVLPKQAVGLEGMNLVTSFNVEEIIAKYAKNKKISPTSIRSAMQDLANQGFISYDPVTGEGKAGNKLKHYYASMKKRKDHDFISMMSLGPPRMNARIDLDSSILFVYGIQKFTVSDSLGVTIKPKEEVLRIGKNRDITFNGEISAGNFVVHGEKFKFSYDFYQVDLPLIDSIEVVPDAKKKSSRDRAKTASRLYGKDANAEEGTVPKMTSGVLFLNKPDNKSNRIKMPQYPIFDVQAPSYIYFDKEAYLKRAYDKRVFFFVPPFRVDSIAGSNLSAISFNGTFHSDDIFPDFKERMGVRPDKTLGFEHQVPEDGYQLYKGPGKFFGTVTMDGKGIRGKGYIKYLTTTVKSDDFIFYQDSIVANGPSVQMEAGNLSDSVGFPEGVVAQYHMKWLTKADTMYLSNTGKTPWYLYGKEVRLNGTLAINSTGAFGSGLIKASGSRMESPLYSFKGDRFTGRNAFFEVQSQNPVKPAFASKNVKFDFFIRQKRAEFAPEIEGFASNEFPYARFKTSIPKAVWDLEKQEVRMTKPDNYSLQDSYFYSTLPDQDSLNFMATDAVYDIKRLTLTITGVPHINVADAMVTPDSGRVVILENADIQPLTKAVLVMDTVNKYHRLVNGSITIKSRHVFEGEATYQYINTVNDTLPIKFDKFEFVKTEQKDKSAPEEVHTKSGAEIDEDQPLKIASGVLFKGGVTMYAEKPTLEFNGFVKLDLRKTDTEWLRYSTTGESKEFVLDLKGATDAEGNPLTTGLYLEDGTSELYGIFVNAKRTSADVPVFQTTGMMNFNSETQEFKVGSTDKANGKVMEGSIFSYNDSTGRASFEGPVSFLSRADKDFVWAGSGHGVGQLDSSNYTFTTLAGFEFALPSKAWTTMAKTLAEKAKQDGLPEAIGEKADMAVRLAEIGGEKVGAEYAKSTKTIPLYQAWPKFAKSLVITDVTWKWHKKETAFYTTSKIGVSNIQNTNINAVLDGFIEIKKTDAGDLVSIYLEASPEAWFYFSYDDQKRMATTSSVPAYNEAIEEKQKGAKPGSYYVELAEETERITFLKHFKKDYQGQEVLASEFAPPVQPKEEEVAPEENNDEEGASESTGKKKESKKKKKKKSDEQSDNPDDGEPPIPDSKKDEAKADEGDFGSPAVSEEKKDQESEEGEEPAKKKDKKKKKKSDEEQSDEAAPEEKKEEAKPKDDAFSADDNSEPAKTEEKKEEPKKEEPKAEPKEEPKKEEPKKDDTVAEEKSADQNSEEAKPKDDAPAEETADEPAKKKKDKKKKKKDGEEGDSETADGGEGGEKTGEKKAEEADGF